MITATLGDRPWYRLTRHFFTQTFDFGVLSEAGADAFRRVTIGIIAAILTSGLLLARIYRGTATGFAAPITPLEAARLTAFAGDVLMIGLPMLVVAFVTLLVSQSLVPDDTDIRVLLVLPVSPRMVFLAKLLAFGLFTGLFTGAAHLAMMPLQLRFAIGPSAEQFGCFGWRRMEPYAESSSPRWCKPLYGSVSYGQWRCCSRSNG